MLIRLALNILYAHIYKHYQSNHDNGNVNLIRYINIITDTAVVEYTDTIYSGAVHSESKYFLFDTMEGLHNVNLNLMLHF